MVTLTLVGGETPWPSRTFTIGVMDDRTLPAEAERIVRSLVRSLLAGTEPTEADDEDEEPEAVEAGTLGL